MKKLNVFLDLEGTIIEDWFNPVLLEDKINKIRNFLIKNNIKEVGIFSMVVTNENDKELFENFLKPKIEQSLKVKISNEGIIIIDDIFMKICKKNKIHVPSPIFLTDVFNFNIKEEMFERFVRDVCEIGGSFVLFDDVVEDKTILINDKVIVFKKI